MRREGTSALAEACALCCERLLALARSVSAHSRYGRPADDGIRWPQAPFPAAAMLRREVGLHIILQSTLKPNLGVDWSDVTYASSMLVAEHPSLLPVAAGSSPCSYHAAQRGLPMQQNEPRYICPEDSSPRSGWCFLGALHDTATSSRRLAASCCCHAAQRDA